MSGRIAIAMPTFSIRPGLRAASWLVRALSTTRVRWSILIAAKAIKTAGVHLKGDLLVSAVVAETSHEPSDGQPGELVETQDLDRVS